MSRADVIPYVDLMPNAIHANTVVSHTHLAHQIMPVTQTPH